MVATGIGATVREFADAAFAIAGLNSDEYVTEDEKYYRPTEVESLIGDASKIREKIGWHPSTDWKKLAELMVKSDLQN